MRNLKYIFVIVASLCSLVSCVDVEEYPDTVIGNTEALWHIMDERYCFFQEKKELYGVDWDEVHSRYSYQASNAPQLSNAQLLEFLGGMLGTLMDGHVNLSTSFDYSREWSWKENFPSNFSDSIQRIYLGNDYRIACGMSYRILDDNTGYIYVPTFEHEIGDGNLDQMLFYLAPCTRLIIDVRNNGGGLLTEARRFASRFCAEPTLVGYMCHKTGKGHNDFSERREQWIDPSVYMRWNKQVYVLTNRSVYSAANEFVKYMKCMPQVTVIGDKTGGGSGMPFSSELPNGWSVRFSACPMYDAEGNSSEDGVEPDIAVNISEEDYTKGIDTILETARKAK